MKIFYGRIRHEDTIADGKHGTPLRADVFNTINKRLERLEYFCGGIVVSAVVSAMLKYL